MLAKRNVVVGLLGGALLIVLSACRASSTPQAQAETPARRSVTALGRLEPRGRVIDISVAGDERLSTILVKEGQLVKAGEILAYLESYESRVASRDRAVTTIQDTERQLAADVELGQARIHQGELNRTRLKDVSVREIQAQEAKVREIHAELDLAVRDRDRAESLSKSSVIAPQEADRQSSNVARIRASLESAEATLQRLKTGASSDLQLAEAEVATRKTELESTRAAAHLQSLRQAANLAEADLKRTVIRAPSDGQIIEVIANPGEALFGRILLRMGDVSQMYVLAEVYEADVSRVRTGQRVEVTSSALSKPLTGIVERVGTNVLKRQVPNLDPQADTDVRIVQVRARLDGSEEAARFVDLQVDVRIQIDD
jgi:HlyD family secretion protein